MGDRVDLQTFVGKELTSASRVLLINPPVWESRYQWIKWNQPLDLLKLSTYLKSEIGCQVRLFDFMVPNRDGKVGRTSHRSEPRIELGQTHYNIYHFGATFAQFDEHVQNTMADWIPDLVVVTSLTSYWARSVVQTVNRVINTVPGGFDVPVGLLGAYPGLEPEHARANIFCEKKILLSGTEFLIDQPSDLSAYDTMSKRDQDGKLVANGTVAPTFAALDIRSRGLIDEIRNKITHGMNQFVFFNDDILSFVDPLSEIAKEQDSQTFKTRFQSRFLEPRFYGICGVQPNKLTAEVAHIMRKARFEEIYIEPAILNGCLDIDAYKQAHEALAVAGLLDTSIPTAGFVFVGRPDDDRDTLVEHLLNMLELFGSVIPKPYSPTPGSAEYEEHIDKLPTKKPHLLSPHLFPFSEINGIDREEYNELYRMTAFINKRVRGTGFDLLPGTVGYEFFRNSIEREVWNLA
jgi:hypothetical protein